ncbi:MFS transporter [Desulfofustis glycolicus]|nr:MFS transporter [Desulfofustis glycolicus]MCB2216409.1 MFS transporter [Desulfobulbaceae bacterium]
MSLHSDQRNGRERLLFKLSITTVVTICSLYAAQPIQPVFQQEFGLSSLQALLFTTLMMLPLGCAPLFYGYLLELIPARRILRGALLILGILELLFSLANGYVLLLSIRALQGLVLPAVLISLMSYISYTTPRHAVQQAVAVYVGMTIIGGILGRILSGICTELFGWRLFFFLLALLFFWCWHLLGALDRRIRLSVARPDLREIAALLHRGPLLWLYGAIFFIFFAGAALLNLIPLELMRINPQLSETAVGLLYLGNSMGIFVALGNARIQRFCKGEITTVVTGLVVFMLGTVGFLAGHYLVMFVAMFVFCLGMFAAHATLSGYVSRLVEDHKPVANGLYMSFYYFGGAVGSFVPGLIYVPFGWRWFILALLVIELCALLCIVGLRSATGHVG